MNTHRVFTALFTAILLLGCISSASAFKKKHVSQGSAISGADNKLRFNHHIDPYVPNDLTGVDGGNKVSVVCTEEGVLTPEVRYTRFLGTCLDYKSRSQGTLWRMRIIADGPQGGMIERVFQHSGNSMIVWVVFAAERDRVGRVLYASAGAQQQYLASKGNPRNQREPELANGDQNSSPLQGLPNVGGIPLGTILNEVLRKGK
jgi:hypothetical protein